jgi:hypothetical protein
MVGDRAAALNAYREARSVSSTEAERRRAALGVARELLPDDPAAARAQILSIAGGPPAADRWEAKYVSALASSLLGDSQGAQRLANEALADAANAGLKDLALLRVATLQAGLAAARHDVAAERTMLTAANGLKVSAAPALQAQLPVCGDGGVKTSDYVIFGFVTGPYGMRQLFPIAASRLEVVAIFQHALDRTFPITADDVERPVGTIFTAECRTLVSPDFTASTPDDPLFNWFIERGMYPASASNDSNDKHLNAIADRTDALAARFGKDSPLLIAPRWQTAILLERRAQAGDPVLPGQLADLATQIARGLRQAGAPEWIAQAVESRSRDRELIAEARDDPAKLQAIQGQITAQLLQLPFQLGRQYFIRTLRDLHGDWPTPLAGLAIDLNAKAPLPADVREHQAWLLMLADAQRALGEKQAARTTLASGNFEKDLCAVGDSEPKILEQHFSYEDYPENLIEGEQEGSVAIEFNLTTAGAITTPRVVYSLPSGLFDDVTTKGLSSIRYTPPTRSGKPAACRGIVQVIQWRIGDESDFVLPTLTPNTPGPVS